VPLIYFYAFACSVLSFAVYDLHNPFKTHIYYYYLEWLTNIKNKKTIHKFKQFKTKRLKQKISTRNTRKEPVLKVKRINLESLKLNIQKLNLIASKT